MQENLLLGNRLTGVQLLKDTRSDLFPREDGYNLLSHIFKSYLRR